MLKVVVAEDELPLLRGLACLIERLDSNFMVVYKAKNGKEALEYLTQHDADILFTDINMPVLNGIQLMEQAQQLNPQLMVVVISGYNDFEYAKQAMQFGAKNYLLKPIDRNELTNVLNRLAHEAAHHSYAQKRSALIEGIFCKNSAAIESCTWKPMTMIYMCLGSYQGLQTAEELPKPGALFDVSMWHIIIERWGCTDFWLFSGIRPNEAVWIFETPVSVTLSELQQLVWTRFQQQLPITAAYQTEIKAADVHKQIEQLSQWVTNGVVLGQSHLLKSCPVAQQYLISIPDKSALRLAVQKQKWDEFSILVQRIVEHRQAKNHITQIEMENFLTEILELVAKETGTQMEHEPRITAQELISASEDYPSLFSAFFKYCRELSQNVWLDVSDKETLMQSLDEYIQGHIAESLSLKELSQKFGLVAPYLSKLFKSYKGMTLAQYIQEVRIDNAKRMLRENPSMLSKEIAEALGYSNPLYFSKTFYKRVGIYPSEYRAKTKEE